MNIKIIAISAVMAIGSLASANAAETEELVLTSVAKSANGAFSIDVVTGGTATALQFNIALPKNVKPGDVDLSRCMADLPKHFEGHCNVAKGQIIGIAYNDEGVALPAGIVSVGQIGFKGKANSSRQLKVLKFVMSDVNATELPVSSTISAE